MDKQILWKSDRKDPCLLCEQSRDMHGVELCNRCWELAYRINGDVVLAKSIIESFEKTEKFTCIIEPKFIL